MEGIPVRGSIVCYDENGEPSNILKSILFQELIRKGIMFGPGAIFVSYSHNLKDINQTLRKCDEVMKFIKKEISTKDPNRMLKGSQMKKVMTF